MTDPVNGRPRLPLWIPVVSAVVAVASVSVLLLVLYEETKGPAEILREFARRVDRSDCQGSYELLDESVRDGMSEEQWCTQSLPPVDEGLDADFDLESAFLENDVYEVEISGVELTTWRLHRFGERSWRVLGTPEGLPVVAEFEDSSGSIELTPDA
jgi:hypothetical protein